MILGTSVPIVDPSGLNIPAMLTLFEALLDWSTLTSTYINRSVASRCSQGQTPDIVVTELHTYIGFGGFPIMVTLMENPNH